MHDNRQSGGRRIGYNFHDRYTFWRISNPVFNLELDRPSLARELHQFANNDTVTVKGRDRWVHFNHLIRARTVWRRATNIGMVTYLRDGKVCRGRSHSSIQVLMPKCFDSLCTCYASPNLLGWAWLGELVIPGSQANKRQWMDVGY